MNNKPYTLKELQDIIQDIHDRETEGAGVFMSVIEQTDDDDQDCSAMCIGMDANMLANVIHQIIKQIGPGPVFAVLAHFLGDSQAGDPEPDPLDTEVLEI